MLSSIHMEISLMLSLMEKLTLTDAFSMNKYISQMLSSPKRCHFLTIIFPTWRGATFHNDANFTRVRFNGKTDFSYAVFDGKADFSRSDFKMG